MSWINIKCHGPYIGNEDKDKQPPYGKRIMVLTEFRLSNMNNKLKFVRMAKYCCMDGWIFDNRENERTEEVIAWSMAPEIPVENQ